jgi:hypothetical protein
VEVADDFRNRYRLYAVGHRIIEHRPLAGILAAAHEYRVKPA